MNLDKFRKRKWRVWFRVIHRDLGFLIFGLSIIYAVSGITLNHINDWNPSYYILDDEIELSKNISGKSPEEILAQLPYQLEYMKHLNKDYGARIFVAGGTVDIYTGENKAKLEVLKRKPVFYEFNFLHYNRSKLWIGFSDVFAAILIIVSVSGLFLVKGKYGVTRWGAAWLFLGILIPAVFLILVL